MCSGHHYSVIKADVNHTPRLLENRLIHTTLYEFKIFKSSGSKNVSGNKCKDSKLGTGTTQYDPEVRHPKQNGIKIKETN